MSTRQFGIAYYVLQILLVLYTVQPTISGIIKLIECDEGVVKSVYGECDSYLQCLDGKYLIQKCPSESYFDETYEVCVIDINGICGPAKDTCVEGELVEDPENYCGYLQCSNESFVEVNCPSGSFFNESIRFCAFDENNICRETCLEGELKADPVNYCGYLQCAKGNFSEIKCENGSYFNATVKLCQVDKTGVCSAIPEKCADGELEEDPVNYCGYLKCANGTMYEVKCPIGRYFNSSLETCLIDEYDICSETCMQESIVEDPDNFCGYLLCLNGSYNEVECPVGSYFNTNLNTCLFDEYNICLKKCWDGSIKEDPENFCGYLQCINKNFTVVYCPNGSYFNFTLNICLIDHNGICGKKCAEGALERDPQNPCGYLRCLNGSLHEVKCFTGSYFNASQQACLTASNGVCSLGISCFEDEVKEDPEDCAAYLQCVNEELVKTLCSYGSYFHQALKRCVVDDDGVCIALKDSCEEGDREVDLVDCTSYVECIDGDFIAQQCVNGSYFDNSIKSCIVDEKFVCIPPFM